MHPGSKSSGKRRVASSPSSRHGSSHTVSVRSSISWRSASPSAVTERSAARARRVSASHPASRSDGDVPRETGIQSGSYPSHALCRIDASAPLRPSPATRAQCVSPRHSRRQLTACHPDRTGSAGRGMRRWAAKKTRPTVGSASITDHSGAPSAASGSRTDGAYTVNPSSTATSRACHSASNVVEASTSSNAAAMAAGEMDPKAPTTASGPAGASGAARDAM